MPGLTGGDAAEQPEDWAWSRPGPEEEETAPPGVDTSKPSIARVYDAAIGGRDNYAVDRAVVEELRKISPEAMEAGKINRAFLIRSVRYLAEQGIDQFLDLGSGLPTAQNTHQVAQSVNPQARVVYVDNDPIVYAHGQAILAKNAHTRVITADFLDYDGVLTHPEVEGFLDLSRPIGLVMLAVIHHVLDEEDPRGLVAAYRDRVAPGSYLTLSHVTNAFPETRELESVMVKALGRGQMRDREEITAFFDGFSLVQPGIVALPYWRPDEPVAEPLGHAGLLALGGVGRKPLDA